MNRQNWKVWVLSLAIVAVVGPAVYARNGQPSKSELQQMGLGGMTVMSDNEAMAIRGTGFSSPHRFSLAVAAGGSFAVIDAPGATAASGNPYFAVGQYSASGKNHSEAGLSVTQTEAVFGVGILTTSTTVKVWAGGSSSAKAF